MALRSSLTLSPGSFIAKIHARLRTDLFVFCESEANLGGRKVPTHLHTSSHFLLIVGGNYITEARNQSGVCGPGTLIFTPMGTAHCDRFQQAGGRFLTITPEPEIASQLDGALPVSLVVQDVRAQALASAAAVQIRGNSATAMVVEGLALELLGRLTRPLADSRHTPSWLLEARDMVADCCTSEFSIRKLAEHAGVHPVHLARAFRRHFFISPMEYLRHCRIQRARGLLRKTSLPLVDVASEVGFSDQSHFANAFKRETGMTPGFYRKLDS